MKDPPRTLPNFEIDPREGLGGDDKPRDRRVKGETEDLVNGFNRSEVNIWRCVLVYWSRQCYGELILDGLYCCSYE